jgi:uncharacterized protein YlxP (DUF503 family)
MNAGIFKIKIHIPENHSLKEKRRIVKSLMARLRNQYNISIAEVDDHDLWQIATIGISCISNSNNHVDQIISNIIKYIEQNYPELEIVNHEIEIMHGF